MAQLTDLSERFVRGLAEYNLTIEEINSGAFRYAGGDGGYMEDKYKRARNRYNRHYRYFELCLPEYEFPPYQDHCVCKHHLVENCYIYSEEKGFLIIGNCCIKRFMDADKAGRTCEKCKAPHKNRKWNLCNRCKPKKPKAPSRKKNKGVIVVPR